MGKTYGQYCPVSLGSEVLADRWTPLILREMILGSTRFNEMERCLPGISRTLLAQRLAHLERKGVVQRVPAVAGRGSEYHLTEAGAALEPVLAAMGEWAVRWVFAEPTREVVDPVALTWWMHRRVDRSKLPDRRVVVEFDFRGPEPLRIWLVLDRGDPSVCIRHPGFDSDLVVSSDPVDFMRVFSGIETLDAARDEGRVELAGPPALTRAFGSWFLWSPFAPAVREQVARQASAV